LKLNEKCLTSGAENKGPWRPVFVDCHRIATGTFPTRSCGGFVTATSRGLKGGRG
jgi:hypothetical protein